MDDCCKHYEVKKKSAKTSKYVAGLLALIIVIGFGSMIFSSGKTKQENTVGQTMNVASQKNQISVYKSDACGCCDGYMSHLDKKGFDVKPVEVQDISQIKQKYNIPTNMQSCHTSVVDGYVVEGHVPAEAINKLLSEKPDIVGITLPGMPSAAPGMPGSKTNPFVIYTLEKDGTNKVFMTI